MTKTDKAILFAVKAHSGTTRKGTNLPYIIHPMETAVIAASMTDNENVIAAAILHDVLEDTRVTGKELKFLFGQCITDLVVAATEDRSDSRAASVTWKTRKQHTIDATTKATRDEKIVILSDKLANVRAIHRDYHRIWEALWERFNQKDPNEQLWYYKSFLQTCRELSDTEAYDEYARLLEEIESRVREFEDYGSHGSHMAVISVPGDEHWLVRNINTGEILSFTNEEFEMQFKLRSDITDDKN